MKVITTIGIVMMVLGFLANSVEAFPLADLTGGTTIEEDTLFSAAIVEETTAKIGTMYTSVIEDLMSFADNPDLALAQSRRDSMTVFAEDLAGRFQLFADDLQLELDAITEAPLAPTGLTATASNGDITLDWNDNTEPDLDFYNVYRATVSGGPFSFYAGGVNDSAFIDGGTAVGTTYHYVVTAVNASMVESEASTGASATP